MLDPRQSRCRASAALAVALLLGALPAAADAHGPLAPDREQLPRRGCRACRPASSAKVVDGDQRMWLNASRVDRVVVFDYRGAPYLLFTPGGVAVNRNSAMYYLNQTPAQNPPAGPGPATPPSWQAVTSARQYSWHDGRLHALAAVALLPGNPSSEPGGSRCRSTGAARRSRGGLWHADDPSLVWFWPIVVILACALAAGRVGRRRARHDRLSPARRAGAGRDRDAGRRQPAVRAPGRGRGPARRVRPGAGVRRSTALIRIALSGALAAFISS